MQILLKNVFLTLIGCLGAVIFYIWCVNTQNQTAIQFTDLNDTEIIFEITDNICINNGKTKTIIYTIKYVVDKNITNKSYNINKIICNDNIEFQVPVE